MNAQRYVQLAKGSSSVLTGSFGERYENEQPLKDQWLRAGKKILKALAKELGLAEGTYDLRVNKAGTAVSGDVHLHGEWIYVDLSQSCLGPDWGFMWRLCKGRKDYTGGSNQWSKWDLLLDLPKLACIMKDVRTAQDGKTFPFERTFKKWD